MTEQPQNQPDEALVDLLIKQATEGLSAAEQRTLDALDSAVASAYARDLERAAAAIALAGSTDAPKLPAEFAQRLAQQADAHFAGAAAAGNAIAAGSASGADRKIVDLEAARAAASAARVQPRPLSRTSVIGWFAAAACLVLAVLGWMRTPQAPIESVVQVPPVVAPIEKPLPLTPAEERAALLAKSDSLKITLGATKDPGSTGMSGDVVWDPATQRGYIHFTGLLANNPAVHQYQIWIFDGGRDKRYPVDGGVFDVPANTTEVVIPIRAALMVLKPAAFAVTVEKPGGVVVSGREHVVALGAAG
jgi:Anti-sigma-K factor rskA